MTVLSTRNKFDLTSPPGFIYTRLKSYIERNIIVGYVCILTIGEILDKTVNTYKMMFVNVIN